MMKGKENRNRHVPTDEPYVDNLNLVTGDKFNYDKPLITERQIKQLCVNEKITLREKFMTILNDGTKLQKWSIFENFGSYLADEQDAFKILSELSRNYPQLAEFLPILGQGIANYLESMPKYLSKQCISILFELTYRTITQNPSQVDDWGKVLQKLAKYPYINIQKCQDYINGSFSMNSPPERRRAAFCMIRHLINYSKDIERSAMNRVLFFNKDQNYKTRIEICYVMARIIENNDKDDQVWKAVWEYFHDKELCVREIAAKILCGTFYEPNFQILIHAFLEEGVEAEACKYIDTFILTFRKLIDQQQRPKNEIISFLNRVIKSKKAQNIATLLDNLTMDVIQVLGQGTISQNINFSSLPLKTKQIMQSTIKFYHSIQDIQFKQGLKSLIFKNLKQMQYEYYGRCDLLCHMFDFTQQDQLTIYLSFCGKLLQCSKWHQLNSILTVFRKIVFVQSQYQRGCAFMLKLWMSCPALMMDLVIQNVIYLVIINKKSFQFLITIRQKILNAKFWSHRKNYIIFYSQLRSSTSFDCHKFIPILLYKNIICDKSAGVRLTLIQYAPDIYKYTDPQCTTQKNLIKEAMIKLEEDRDVHVRERAALARMEIQRIQKNSGWLGFLYQRNRALMEKELALVQVTSQPKRVIKTQNEISRSIAKSKRKITNEQQRKTINVGKIQMHKDMSIDSITLSTQSSQKPLTLMPKKSNLFRCHSVKIKVPNKKA